MYIPRIPPYKVYYQEKFNLLSFILDGSLYVEYVFASDNNINAEPPAFKNKVS